MSKKAFLALLLHTIRFCQLISQCFSKRSILRREQGATTVLDSQSYVPEYA